MAEMYIEEIYKYANSISILREVVELFRHSEDFSGSQLFQKHVAELAVFLQACLEDEFSESEVLQRELYSLKSIKDVVYIADKLEERVIPIMERWMQHWVSVEEQVDTKYKIESTATGFLTLKDALANIYLHSNNDPMDEARRFIESRFEYDKSSYKVWGCGLGYHIYQLFRISEGTIPIIVYESNPNIIRYALQYGVLSWIPKENLIIMPGYSGEEFLNSIDTTEGVIILKNYVYTMKNIDLKRKLISSFLKRDLKNEKLNFRKEELDNTETKDRFAYANTISLLRQVISCTRLMDEYRAKWIYSKIKSDIKEILNVCKNNAYLNFNSLAEAFEIIDEIDDCILMGDIIESICIPLLEEWVQSSEEIVKGLDDRYVLESTKNGFFTIKDSVSDIYLHSKIDPMYEARLLVERQFNNKFSQYAVWGCGLGYHIYQLYCISEGKVTIDVYETNRDIGEYAYKYGVLSWIPKNMLQIIYVKKGEEFFSGSQDKGTLYLKNYIVANSDKDQRNLLNQVFYRHIFQYDAMHNLKLNYYSNKKLGLSYVSEIDYRKLKKEMVVIGGGPSLDHYLDTLKEWQNKKTIIAAGTVWKKLLNVGIRPDYVVIMDPYDIVFQQVQGIEDTSATLLLAMQAYWKVGRYYKGQKYLIPAPIPIADLESNLINEGVTPWFAGGSVTVSELEFAMRMFADKVYLLGVDLSLPGGFTHAEGTRFREKVSDFSELIPQEDVNGNIVYTNSILIESKAWFELIMSETEGIEYINMSDVGVKLKGTIPYERK